MAELDLKAMINEALDGSPLNTASKIRKLSIQLSFTNILLGSLIARTPELLDDPFLKAVYEALCASGDDAAFNEALKALQPLLDEFLRQHAAETPT